MVKKKEQRFSCGKGLRLHFDFMAILAAVEFSTAIGGGMILVDCQTALIPIKIEDDCAQFYRITAGEGQIDPYARWKSGVIIHLLYLE
jgi:hypothetical protein